jgi:alanine racemase
VEEVARLAGLELVGVFSHFAGSEDPTGESARLQLDRFLGVLEELRRRGVEVPVRHMANSGAILSLPASHLDMVRPGLLLYGYTPRASMPGGEELLPVLSLKSRISYIKSVGPGTTISYGGKFVTNRATTIATVPIGYGDGYSRLLTHRSEVLIRGRRFPTVGSICMDHLMVDLGTDGGAEEGDDVTLIGRDGDECITCWEIARHMGSIPYEVTCLITPRVDRVFIE